MFNSNTFCPWYFCAQIIGVFVFVVLTALFKQGSVNLIYDAEHTHRTSCCPLVHCVIFLSHIRTIKNSVRVPFLVRFLLLGKNISALPDIMLT